MIDKISKMFVLLDLSLAFYLLYYSVRPCQIYYIMIITMFNASFRWF